MRSKSAATPRRARKEAPGQAYLKRREGSPEWQIDFTVDGHRLRQSSGTSDVVAAGALALQLREELWRQIKLGVKAAKHLSVNDAFVRYYEEVSEGTSYGEKSQKYHLAALLKHLGARTLLSDLDDERINGLVQALRKATIGETKKDEEPRRLSSATVNRYLTTLSVVCKRARKIWKVEVGGWELSTHKLAESKGREVFLDHAQARLLLDAACGHLKPILLLALSTGLRSANALGLQWEHISMDMGTAVMIQKGDKPLAIALPDVTLRLLATIEPDPAKRRGPVFWFGNPTAACDCQHCQTSLFRGKPIKSVKRAFAAAAERAGVRHGAAGRLRFHDLRHSYASWLLASSGNLLLVSKALGHADVSTTQRYAHLMPGRQKEAINDALVGLEAPAPTVKRIKA